MSVDGTAVDGVIDGGSRPGDLAWTVSEELRQAIRRGELRSGVQVRQAEWATRLGVSRVPVREALTALVANGLLAHSSHQGYFVADLSDSEAVQLYRLRHLIDIEISQTLPWPNKRDLAVLHRHCNQILDAQAKRDVLFWIEANENFMMELYGLSPLTIFVTEAKHLWDRCELLRVQRTFHVVTADENIVPVQILRAIEAKDRNELVRAWSATTSFDLR